VREEFIAARAEFLRIFGGEARTAGAAGWQSNARSREVYDEAISSMRAMRAAARRFSRASTAKFSRRSKSRARCRRSTN